MKVLWVVISWWFSSVAPVANSELAPLPLDTKVRHEFYVSVTDINVDLEKELITGVVKTFPDDWERAMNALLREKVRRYIQLDSTEIEAMHAQYLAEHMNLKLGTERLPVQYEITRRGPDEVYLLFTAPYGERTWEELAGPWSVKFTLLADIYPSQENIVILHYGTEKFTNSCREGNDYFFTHSF
jgi:hypothetical protein